jgi:hypothetical protein
MKVTAIRHIVVGVDGSRSCRRALGRQTCSWSAAAGFAYPVAATPDRPDSSFRLSGESATTAQ